MQRVAVKVTFAPVGFKGFQSKFQKLPIVSRRSVSLSTSTEVVSIIMETPGAVLNLIIIIREQKRPPG